MFDLITDWESSKPKILVISLICHLNLQTDQKFCVIVILPECKVVITDKQLIILSQGREET